MTSYGCHPFSRAGLSLHLRPQRRIRVASELDFELLTIDGSGGGTGMSPNDMLDNWGVPSVLLHAKAHDYAFLRAAAGKKVVDLAMGGGLAKPSQAFKALALGAPYISAVGLCRSSMAAAMSAKKIGDLIEAGKVPPELARFGTTKEELFSDLPELRGLYGSAADGFSTGAVGVYSYLNRIAYGLRHFAALNRKFDVKHIGRRDVFPLTRDAKELLDGTWLR